MKLILLSCFVVAAQCLPQISNPRWKNYQQKEDYQGEITEPSLVPISHVKYHKEPTELELQQNQNAQYSFNTNIDDKINDQTQQRSEVRKGLNVEGSYSYSDGYFKRTYHYVADDKGYRIVKQEVVPLEGPKVNLDGTASVDTAAHGTKLSYRVQSVAAVGPKIVERIE